MNVHACLQEIRVLADLARTRGAVTLDFAKYLHAIDRVDNDKGYWCGHCEECVSSGRKNNCRWATDKEQASNRDSTVYMTHGGDTLHMSDWAKKLGISKGTLGKRINKWGVERALSTPKDFTRVSNRFR